MKLETKQKNAVLFAVKIIICTLGLILLGIGSGMNLGADQGADPITVFYDGLSINVGCSAGQVATMLNAGLIILVLIFDYFNALKQVKAGVLKSSGEIIPAMFKHIHVGTVVYLLVLGAFMDFGIWVYNKFSAYIPTVAFGGLNVSQIIVSLIGCVLCFVGLGGFMAADVGIDPWTAIVLILSEKTQKPFKLIKIILDAITLVFGWLMGGVVGLITLFCVFVGGPIIQKSAELLDKSFKKVLKSNYEA